MIMYAKIVNQANGLCIVGSGSNTAQYRAMAMTPMDVQQSDIDGQWYLKSKCPMKTEEQKELEKRERIQELSMTRSDFFDGTIKAFGADSDDLLKPIEYVLSGLEIDATDKKVALNNYKNAQNFYRKHPLFTMLSGVEIPIGKDAIITISSEQWDRFFDTKDWKYLTTHTLVINATTEDGDNADCNITISQNPVPYGEIAYYKVECEGYQTVEGDVIVVEDEVFDVVLEKIVEEV